MTQPAGLYLSRQLVRVMPFAAQKAFNQAINQNARVGAEFDCGVDVSDQNQLLGQFPTVPPNSEFPIQAAVGPYVDVVVFVSGGVNDQKGVVGIEYAIDLTTRYRPYATIGITGNTTVNVSALRVTGRLIKVYYRHDIAEVDTLEFGIYVRSN